MREAELIRALAEDLALEILTSYTEEDFESADLPASEMRPSISRSTGPGPGPALQQLIARVQSAAGSPAEPDEPPVVDQP